MGIFNRKPTSEPAISGTQALRHHVKLRTSGPNGSSFARIAGEINDALDDIANRAAARGIATRMAPDGNEAAARSIAASLRGNLGTAASTVVTGQQLEDFANDRRDLAAEIKNQLAIFLHAGHVVFNAASGQLESAYAHEPRAISGIPPQWVHPDPVIAKAQAVYKAALETARRR